MRPLWLRTGVNIIIDERIERFVKFDAGVNL